MKAEYLLVAAGGATLIALTEPTQRDAKQSVISLRGKGYQFFRLLKWDREHTCYLENARLKAVVHAALKETKVSA